MQDEFFLQLLDRLNDAGCPCAITGGLACVEFGIVEHTSDCDVLCRPEKAEVLLTVLSESEWNGKGCQFRGSMSAPLAAAWLEGGWTYAALVRGHRGLGTLSLLEQNKVRLEYAERALSKTPLTAQRVLDATALAKELVGVGLSAEVLDFLPQVGPNFTYRSDDE